MNEPKAISGHPRGKRPFAPEGWPFMIALAVPLLAALFLCWWVPAAVLFLLLVCDQFFRDPERLAPSEAGLFIAPADGKVIRVEATSEGLRIAFARIAGFVARRIASCVAVGDRVERGERVGMIRFAHRL
jgi:phosphatidylserine decarboxylase